MKINNSCISKNRFMKNKLITLALLAGLSLNISCNRDDTEIPGSEKGTVSLTLASKSGLDPMTPAAAGANPLSFSTPAAADFKIAILTTANPPVQVQAWNSYAEMPSEVKLKEGAYKLTASYGNAHTGGVFGQPRFAGETDFTLVRQQTSDISLTASIADVIVTAEYTEGFKNYFKDYALTFIAENTRLAFAKDETRPAFFNPGTIKAELVITRQDGTDFTFSPASLTNTKGGEHYAFTFDVGENGAGEAALLVSFDETTTETPVQIDLSEDWLPKAAPFCTSTGFDAGYEFDIVEGVEYTSPLNTLITARARIASCVISTTSGALIAKGWPASVDLVGIDAAAKAKLKSFGLIWTETLAGLNMAQIDFKNIVKYMPAGDTEPIDNVISVVTTDDGGQASEPLEITFRTSPPEFTVAPLTGTSRPKTGTRTTETFTLNVTKGDSRNFHFKYYDADFRQWVDALSVFNSVAGTTVKYDITIPWDWTEVSIRAFYGDRTQYGFEIVQATVNP